MLLSLKNISKTFSETGITVLKGVSIDIEKGDFVSIVGASGSGKSTLLTIMGGIDKPTSGEVLLHGKDISQMTEKELAVLRRTKIGFVFQFFNLAPNLTVYENIMLPIVLGGKSQKDFKEKADNLLKYLGIEAQAEKFPSKLSGGEQQRVAIARSLIYEPEIIFLDEPTGNLDSKASKDIMSLLKNINEELKTTIVQVTHSKTNASFGNKIVSIEDGSIGEEVIKNKAVSIENEITVIETVSTENENIGGGKE
ncbi:MAG: ABC transporter ATP-binding protein [Firmicutes bacterium]|nr:ABC transporter ATP-binding protein [Bacillota bacterium]